MAARSLLAWSPLSLAILLLAGATFYFLGDTGRHSDDFTVVFRDRATGALSLSNHPWVRWPFFWRPLHLAHIAGINTISWNHPWIGHLELAAIHGLVGWMLAGLLRRLGIRPGVAWATGVLFVVCPLHGEAALWSSASCNAISAFFLLWTLELARRQGAGPESHLRSVWIALLAFITPCWYEPAAAAIAATPLVFIAAGSAPLRSRWKGLVRCTAAAGLGCLAYEALLLATAPSNYRGSATSIVGPARLLERCAEIARESLHATLGTRGRDVILGSIEQGWHTLHSLPGALFLILAAALAICSCVALLTRPAAPQLPAGTTALRPRGLILLTGITIWSFAWLPVIAVDGQHVDLRTLYVPLVGAAMILAGLANGAAGLLGRFPERARLPIQTLACIATLAIAIAGAIGMIGFQTQFRTNAAHDRRATEELTRLLPNPPSGCIFLPLRVDARGASTGRDFYDRAIHGQFENSWYFPQVYHRTDVSMTPPPWWLSKLDCTGYGYLRGDDRFRWEWCVPFLVGPAGEVRLLPRLTVVPTSGSPCIVEFPRVPASTPDTPGVRLREIDGHAYTETTPFP